MRGAGCGVWGVGRGGGVRGGEMEAKGCGGKGDKGRLCEVSRQVELRAQVQVQGCVRASHALVPWKG